MLLFRAALLYLPDGALLTHRYGFEGIMHIREGDKTAQIMIRHDDLQNEIRNVPFTIGLNNFTIHRYP